MSPREHIQDELIDFLENQEKFNAPYGVLKGIRPFAKGKVRTITFGISRYLDAEIQIISPKCITVSGQGGLAYKYAGKYDSVENLKQVLLS